MLVKTRKPRAFASLIASIALSKTPCAADRLIVALAHAVEVNHPHEVDRRLEEMDLLLQQQRVGAEEDELLALDELLDDLRHLLVHERLAAGDRDHRRAALFDRRDALFHAQPLAQDLVGVLNLAAAGAREVALKQRLELEDERILLLAFELLAGDVFRDGDLLLEGHAHIVEVAGFLHVASTALVRPSLASGCDSSLACMARAIVGKRWR